MATSPQIPVLRAGDRLTRNEFERRYAAMPELMKAELLEGVVYMPSPVRYSLHGRPHAQLSGWLFAYAVATPGVENCIESTLRLDLDNEPQPDLMLRIAGTSGCSQIDPEDYLTGAPELVVEIAASSVSYDLHQKLHVYRRSGVREYLVLRTEDHEVDWFVLRGGAYERLIADAQGVLRSGIFPGLWLDVPALLRSDMVALSHGVEAGLRTSEHAAFVRRLSPCGA